MPEIKAFRAWRYNSEKIKDLAKVYAPPYDVISKAEQEKLYAANPYNVIRLELGKEEKGDSLGNNKYTRAAKYLSDWESKGVLIREERPAIYVYAQDYKEEGKPAGGGSASGGKTRLGFFAAMKIDEKAVLKHENTLAAPKKDRLALIKEVRTNLSPIFGLFEDKKAAIQSLLKKNLKLSPIVDVSIDGVRHRIFLETRPAVIEAIQKEMRSKPMFIADGHHRFEVTCQYKKWLALRSSPKASKEGEYVMTYFSDCLHNPFKIFPTHRLVNIPKQKPLLEILKDRGTIKKENALPKLPARGGKYQFGFYSKKEGFFTLTFSKKIAARIKNNPVDRLDVAVLHKHIIEPCFKIHSIKISNQIDFTRDAKEARAKVDKGSFDLAIFLRPTSLKEMILASKKGMKMPQKSTYFYPKLLSGLVFHSLENQI